MTNNPGADRREVARVYEACPAFRGFELTLRGSWRLACRVTVNRRDVVASYPLDEWKVTPVEEALEGLWADAVERVLARSNLAVKETSYREADVEYTSEDERGTRVSRGREVRTGWRVLTGNRWVSEAFGTRGEAYAFATSYRGPTLRRNGWEYEEVAGEDGTSLPPE